MLEQRTAAVWQHLQATGGDAKPSRERRVELNAHIASLNSFASASIPLVDPGTGIRPVLIGIGALIALPELLAIAAIVFVILMILAAILLIIAENVDDYENEKAEEDAKKKAKEREEKEEESEEEKKKRQKEEEDEKKKIGLPCPDPASGVMEAENNVFATIMIHKWAKNFAEYRKDFYDARNGPGTYCQDKSQIATDRIRFAYAIQKAAQVCTLTVCSPDPAGPHGAIIAHWVGFKSPPDPVHGEIQALPFIEAQVAAADPKRRIAATLFSVCLDLACSKGNDSCDATLTKWVAANLPRGYVCNEALTKSGTAGGRLP